MSNDYKINSKLLEEHFIHHRTRLDKMEKATSKKFELATQLVQNLYQFPIAACPWEKNYFQTEEFINANGERIPPHHIIGMFVRQARMQWLLRKALNVVDQRQIVAWTGRGNVAGAFSAKIIAGTYLAQKYHTEKYLVSQQNLLNDLQLVDGGNKSSATTMKKFLKDNTFDKETGLNKNAPYAFMSPEIGNVKKRYYSRVNGRMFFCIRMVLEDANFLAGLINDKVSYWPQVRDHWTNELRHSLDIVDFCLEELRSKQ